MGWKIEYQGAVLREEDVTGAHLSIVNQAIGEHGWDATNPMSSPAALLTWTAVALAGHTKKPLDECMLFVQTQPLLKIIGAYSADAQVMEAVNAEPPPEPHSGFANGRDEAIWHDMMAKANG